MCFSLLIQHQPACIIDIDFLKPKNVSAVQSIDSSPSPSTSSSYPFTFSYSPPTSTAQPAFLVGLKQLYPSAAILTSSFVQPNPHPHQTKHPRWLPATITALYHPNYQKLSEQELKKECEVVFEGLTITKEEADYLAEATQLQSKSLVWFEHRRGQLTASHFRPFCHTYLEKPSQSLISTVLQEAIPQNQQH